MNGKGNPTASTHTHTHNLSLSADVVREIYVTHTVHILPVNTSTNKCT